MILPPVADVLLPELLACLVCDGLRRGPLNTISLAGITGTVRLAPGAAFTVVTIWGGLPGLFEQRLALTDADGAEVLRATRPFELLTRHQRRALQHRLPAPRDEGEYLLVASVDGYPVSRQVLRFVG